MYLKRRDFLKKTAALIGAGLVPHRAAASGAREIPERVLGRTGVAVPVLGYGAMQCADPGTIRFGIDSGINYCDTACCYMGGRNEKIVGQAIAGVRDKVFIATKVHISSESRMRKSVARSLASLGVDRIDLLQLHGVSSREQIVRKDVQGVLRNLQKEGKIRFVGVTTHSKQVEVLRAVMEDRFYDTVLVAVNFRSPRNLFDAIEEAAKRGVGIIAMKTQNGGFKEKVRPELTPHQAALRYILEKPGIHLAVPGMLSRSMVKENTAAVKGKSGLRDLVILEAFRSGLEGKACAFCSECIEQCRYGTGGIDAVRVGMYLEGYGNPDLAKENARAAAKAIGNCIRCEKCTVQCSQSIEIKTAAKLAAPYLA